ncbi:hypothetical protein R3P38DRAFT_3133527 [Favolaschia claudopus]|uniref:Ubiquitin 3 binding protein But2 C-terminal domain-containing protein n=1 Tax=Favolaschia claudopus TaxID=2862362 RepID=A0AAV9Z8D1_9AGAR
MSENREQYTLLNTDEEEIELVKSKHGHPRGLERWALHAILWAAFASLVCSGVNIVFVASLFITTGSFTNERLPNLEFVSPYIGLDSAIHHDSSPFPPIVNFPILLAQVDSAQPGAIALDTHPDRTFKVASGISTIAQFRAIDWGMELCTLNAVIPETTDLIQFMNFTITPSQDNLDSVMVEIWRVSGPEITQPLDASTLSWKTKPKRKHVVGYWSLKPGTKLESEVFFCASNSLHTFEFLCVGDGCHLQFQQDPNDSRIGRARSDYNRSLLCFYVTQRQSKR